MCCINRYEIAQSRLEKYKNNKERFIAAIDYLCKNLSKEELIQILNKSKKLSDERYVTNF